MFRPETFDDFVGQENAKEILKLEIAAAKKTGNRIRHILFSSKFSSGKTNLSEIVAKELNANFLYFSATIVKSPASLKRELAKASKFASTVILLDECHSLPRSIQDNLLSVLEKPAVLCWETKEGGLQKWQLPEGITFIFATTNPEKMTSAFRSRLLTIQLDDYCFDDKVTITEQVFKHAKVKFDHEVCEDIARKARSPRHIKQHCQTIMNYAIVHGGHINMETCKEAYRIMNICERGLDQNERDYITYVGKHGPVSSSNICKRLGVDKENLENVIENFLILNGWLNISSKGRILTDEAKELFGE